jgi:ketosteroid isomerase-like protein
MERVEILDFCRRWLAAWEGNKPEGLIQFYSDDALYVDPANKDGLRGRDRIFPYLKKLLAANPSWKWEVVQLFPTNLGFVVKWRATIPIGGETITEYGMDIVDVERGRITRNEVYFDRSHVLEALRELKATRH